MFTLDKLPYDYNALLPVIDQKTMEIHHDKHHATYIENLNKALVNFPDLQEKSIEDLLANLDSLPSGCQIAVRNHGGGHFNHNLFWDSLTPEKGQEPQGELLTSINNTFGSLADFKTQFETAGLARFGSGWVWLVIDKDKKLSIMSTPNQDNPVSIGQQPLLGVDIWEHAYYLSYQNRRAQYLTNIWDIINFREVEKRFLLCA